MTDVPYVDLARGWAGKMMQREARGPGDLPNAMKRLERRTGIPAGFFWSLRYRPPASILIDVFFRLKEAYETETQRQIQLLEHELAITKAVGGNAATASTVASAEAFLGAQTQPEN